MKYNFIGNTGLLVSELCFGTMTFGGQEAGVWTKIGQLQQNEVDGILRAAIESGINFIDTANVYSFGQAEQLLGQSLINLNIPRDEIVIATKVYGKIKNKANGSGLSRYHIFNAVEDSLRRLKLDYIDILYVHGMDPMTSLEHIVRSLNDVVESGKVRYIAICNWPAWMVAKAQAIAHSHNWHPFIGLQYHYSAATRDIEHEIIPMAIDYNLAVFPWSPLSGGFLTGKYTREGAKQTESRRVNFDFPPINKKVAYDLVDLLTELGKKYETGVAQLALAWVRQQTGVTSTIIGAKTIEQLLSNVKSTTIELSATDLDTIAKVSSLSEMYPGWMIKLQSEEIKFEG